MSVMDDEDGLDPARSCRRQRVCQWRCQCRGAQTSKDDTPHSRYVNVLSVLTAQSVQAMHLRIRRLGVRIPPSAPAVMSRDTVDRCLGTSLHLRVVFGDAVDSRVGECGAVLAGVKAGALRVACGQP